MLNYHRLVNLALVAVYIFAAIVVALDLFYWRP